MATEPDPARADGAQEPDPPDGLFAGTVEVFGWAGVAALLVPTLLICADIVWRRVVGGAFMDIFDIAQLGLVAIASWSIPYAFVHGTHVSVGILADRFPPGVQRWLDVLTYLACALLFTLFAVLAWKSTALHYGYGDTTENLELPLVLYWAVFLIGLGLSILSCLWCAWRAWTDRGSAA